MAKSQFLTKILNRSELDLRDGFSKKNIFPNNCVFLPSTGTLSEWKSTGFVAIFNLFQKLWILVSKNLKWGKLKSHIKTSFPIQTWKMQNCQKHYLMNPGNELFLFRHPNYQKLWRIRSKKPQPDFLGPNVTNRF
jgi:hypothetical protein